MKLSWLLLVVVLVAGSAVAQEGDSVERLKAGFGPTKVKPEPITITYDRGFLRFAMAHAQKAQMHDVQVQQVKEALASALVVGIDVTDHPKDEWDPKHKHFNVTSAKLEAAAIDPGVIMVGVSGAIDKLDERYTNGPGLVDLVPILVQFSKGSEDVVAHAGFVMKPDSEHKDFRFYVYAERLKNAEDAILIFRKASDRSWAGYRDAATWATPADVLLLYHIDEKSLIELENARVAAEKKPPAEPSAAELAKKTAEHDAAMVKREAIEKQQHDAVVERARKQNFARTKFRQWTVLGGSKASEAKIVDYDGKVVTLEKRDGKQVKINESRLNKADREALDSVVMPKP